MSKQQPVKRLTVFLSHSFEDQAPAGSSHSDADVAEFFAGLMKNTLKWQVVTGKPNQARPIGDKVAEAIGSSHAIVAIFSARDRTTDGRTLPSPWVLCECAHALGRFEGQPYIVGGFREKGVNLKDLAMVSASGMELPEYDRNSLQQDKANFLKYLHDLEMRIRTAREKQLPLPVHEPYKQVSLHKIFCIQRSGYCTTHNITAMTITDADRFSSEKAGRMRHRILSQRTRLPPFDQLKNSPIHNRRLAPFFFGRLDSYQKRPVHKPLDVDLEKQSEHEASFFVRFLDLERHPIRLKQHDTVRYQYAWGLPDEYPTAEESLGGVQGDLIDPASFCLAGADANHGPIERLTLELRFEREARSSGMSELFSTSPFYQTRNSFYTDDAGWSSPAPLQKVDEEESDSNLWYEVFKVELSDFYGRIRVAWRPSSRKHHPGSIT